jgi:hypothetical protein
MREVDLLSMPTSFALEDAEVLFRAGAEVILSPFVDGAK